MKTATFTSLFAAAAIVGGLAMVVPADAGSKHKGCNWNGCSTQWSTSNKNVQVNLDLRLRAIVVDQDCHGSACAGAATTGYASAWKSGSSEGSTAGGSTDSYAGAPYGGSSSAAASAASSYNKGDSGGTTSVSDQHSASAATSGP